MRILRAREVIQKTGLSRGTLWRLELGGDFPRRRQIGPQAVGWVSEEVDAWIDSRTQVVSVSGAKTESSRGGTPSDSKTGRQIRPR